jgi:hypothetical protein
MRPTGRADAHGKPQAVDIMEPMITLAQGGKRCCASMFRANQARLDLHDIPRGLHDTSREPGVPHA